MRIYIRTINEDLNVKDRKKAIADLQKEMLLQALSDAGLQSMPHAGDEDSSDHSHSENNLPPEKDPVSAAPASPESNPLPEISLGKHGKPYFPDLPEFHYNFSDSGKFVVLAVSHEQISMITPVRPGELGIDIQKIVPVKAGIVKMAERYFTDKEAEILSSLKEDQQAELFFRLWSIKEAYLKFTGAGLAGGMNSYEIVPKDGRFGQGIIRDRDTQQKLASYLVLDPPEEGYVMAVVTK